MRLVRVSSFGGGHFISYAAFEGPGLKGETCGRTDGRGGVGVGVEVVELYYYLFQD